MTFLALIPKKSAPTTFNDFMLISLCNVLYKLITKTIPNRLKVLLSSFLSKEKFGFLFNH